MRKIRQNRPVAFLPISDTPDRPSRRLPQLAIAVADRAPQDVVAWDAIVEGALVLLSDQRGTRHYIGPMPGVVLLAAPLEGEGTGTWRQHSWTPTMTLDGKAPDIRSRRPTFGIDD